MKEIQLTQGKVALVDDEDFERLCKFTWYAEFRGRLYYARTTIDRRNYYMHRMILGVESRKIFVDHRNHNSLDNQKSNLRRCTPGENTLNKTAHKDGKSKFLGVCWDSSRRKWMATIGYGKRQHYLGRFNDEASAARAYDSAAKVIHGEFANPNFK